MGKQVRLSLDNEIELALLLRDARNDLLTPSKAVNIALRKGFPIARKLFVKHKERNEA